MGTVIKNKIAICNLSDGRFFSERNTIDKTISMIQGLGYKIVVFPDLYHERGLQSSTPELRASFVNSMFKDPSVKAVIDVSGGDLANQCIDYLDYDVISSSSSEFWGYSDLTCVINAIYSITGKSSFLMQATQLARSDRLSYMENLLTGSDPCVPDDIYFIQGSSMEGTLVGGNIRCMLKLAGTRYFPDLSGKILFIEGYGNSINSVFSLLAQHRSMGTLDSIAGLLIGQFTKIDKEEGPDCIDSIVKNSIGNRNIPIARTHLVGHSTDSLALKIGGHISI